MVLKRRERSVAVVGVSGWMVWGVLGTPDGRDVRWLAALALEC